MIGGTRQSVNRLLSELVDEGLVRIERDTLSSPIWMSWPGAPSSEEVRAKDSVDVGEQTIPLSAQSYGLRSSSHEDFVWGESKQIASYREVPDERNPVQQTPPSTSVP